VAVYESTVAGKPLTVTVGLAVPKFKPLIVSCVGCVLATGSTARIFGLGASAQTNPVKSEINMNKNSGLRTCMVVTLLGSTGSLT
jgi:hypothetical protein